MLATAPCTSPSAWWNSPRSRCAGVDPDLARQRVDALVEQAHGAHDLDGRRLDLAGQVLHRIGHHAETAPGVAGTFGLDRRVERDQPRLQRDLRDALRRLRHVAQRGDDAADFDADVLDRHAHTFDRAEPGRRGRPMLFCAPVISFTCDGQRRHRKRAAGRSLGRVVDQAAHFGRFTADGRSLLGEGLDRGAQVDRASGRAPNRPTAPAPAPARCATTSKRACPWCAVQ